MSEAEDAAEEVPPPEEEDVQEDINETVVESAQPQKENKPQDAVDKPQDAVDNSEPMTLYNKLSRSAMRPEPLNMEFLYYSATLKECAPKINSEADRQKMIPWLRKLLRPEYHASDLLRLKRNQYLLALTITTLNDEISGVFHGVPPASTLSPLGRGIRGDAVPAKWENDDMWAETLSALPPECRRMPCSIHQDEETCGNDRGPCDRALDEEFMLLLHLARPYAIMMREPEQRSLVASWFQVLCTIHSDSCTAMRQLRNDYLMALLGYVQDLRVDGPFAELPERPLRPLDEAAELAAAAATLDPGSRQLCHFLAHQPVPDEGAFCYLAVTGELLEPLEPGVALPPS